jgi:hypothetical protein
MELIKNFQIFKLYLLAYNVEQLCEGREFMLCRFNNKLWLNKGNLLNLYSSALLLQS